MDKEIKDFLKTKTKDELINIIDRALQLDQWFETGVREMILKTKTDTLIGLYDESTRAFSVYCDKLKEINICKTKISNRLGKKEWMISELTQQEINELTRLYNQLGKLKEQSNEIDRKIARMEK